MHEKSVIIMQQRGEHVLFLVAIHGWKIPVLKVSKILLLVFSSPPVFTLSWGKIITIIYLACCQLRVFLIMDASCQAVDSYHPINWFEIWMKFHITWTTFPIWFSFFSHFYPIHDSEDKELMQGISHLHIAMSAFSKSTKLV